MKPLASHVHPESIWKNKHFVFLCSGTTIVDLTFHLYNLALPIIIYELSKSPLAMSTMRAIDLVPHIFLGIFIGVVVDRVNRKKMMVLSIWIQIMILLALAILLKFNVISIWSLYICGFILTTFNYLFWNTFHTVLPLIVHKDQLISANASISFLYTFVNMIGPGLAGFILISLGYTSSLIATAASLFLLFIFVFRVKIPNNESTKLHKSKSSIWNDMKDGFHQLRQTQLLWNITIVNLFINIASSLSGAVLIFFALDHLDASKSNIGFILSASGVGGILAATVIKRLTKRFNRQRLVLFGIGLAAFGQFILFTSYHWYVLMTGMFFIGFSSTFMNINFLTLKQELTPPHILGRVNGISSMIMKAAAPISFLSAGWLGELIKINYIFLGSSFMLLVLFIIFSFLLFKNSNIHMSGENF